MRIFAIADTHLSGQPPAKPMEVFGSHWQNHWEKIKTDWLSRVTPTDTVLLAGDISWAMRLDAALPDLEAIAGLPGRKILIRGNHDYWWSTLSKLNSAMGEKLTFLHNTFQAAGEMAVCGSRGWLCPGDHTGADDTAIYERELQRTQASLEAAERAGYKRKILMLHYPPVNERHDPSGFTNLFEPYGVEICVYGHLHSDSAAKAPTGHINGASCHLVACDALGFKLKQIV